MVILLIFLQWNWKLFASILKLLMMQLWWLDHGVTDTCATYSKLVQDVSDTDSRTQNGSLTDVY